MDRSPLPIPRRLTGLALAALVALPGMPGCGGGGGDSGGGTVSTGVIAGRIVIDTGDFGIVAEREPNASIASAQLLPPLHESASYVVAGDAGLNPLLFGRIDLIDAFRFVSLSTQTVDLTLDASTGGVVLGTFDLTVFRTSDGSPVESSTGLGNPKVVSFTADANTAYDVVVSPNADSGAYTLELASSPSPVPAQIATAAVAAIPSAIPSGGFDLSADVVSYALDEPDCADRRLLVRLVDGASADPMVQAAGARLLRRTSGGSLVLEVPSDFRDSGRRAAMAAAARLGAEAGVVFAEPDWIVRPCGVPNDPSYSRQWNLEAIGAPSAWDVTTGVPSIVVGVLDSGIAAHPDLDPQRVPGYDFVTDLDLAQDGDGRDPDPTDTGASLLSDGSHEWHGTHVSGILGARGNDGYGISGVAPGCRVMPLRVTGKGGGTISDLSDAIRYGAGLTATTHGPALTTPLRVLNISLGTSQSSVELQTACQDAEAAGTLICAASGNTGGSVLFPAAYASVLAVGAVDGRLVYASYSGRGPSLDCVAPGGNGTSTRDVGGDGFSDGILSTIIDETVIPAVPGETLYSGTSMATPHVAGLAALVLSVDPSLSVAALRTTILSTCRDLDLPGQDDITGRGLIQAGEAVRFALAALGTPRADAPKLLLSSTTIRIPFNESVATLHVDNGGGGVLHVAGVSTSTDTGVPWLSSFLPVGPHSPAVDAGMVAVSVNRTGLAPGTYAGHVYVSNGLATIGTIRVIMEVGSHPLTAATVLVVAREVPSGVVRATAVADGVRGFRYAFHALRAGSYTITAGTDLDRDGFFCEVGDWCGSFGGSPATAIPVGVDETVLGADVTIR